MPEALPSGVTCHGPQYPNMAPPLSSAVDEEMVRQGLWSPQSVNALGARPIAGTALDAIRARERVALAAPARPIIQGVLCRVTFRTPADVCVGCHVSEVAVLPIWELLDPVITDDFTVARCGDDEPLPQCVYFFPRAFVEMVLKLVPRTGSTAPIAEDDPDYAAVLGATAEAVEREGFRSPPPPSIFSFTDHLLDRLGELAVRSHALPVDVALPILMPYSPFSEAETRERLEALQKDGIARPGYEAAVLREEAKRERSRADAAERARKANADRLSVKRPHHLLVIRRTARASTDPLELAGAGLAPRDLEPIVGDLYRELHGLPGPIAEEFQLPGVSILAADVEMTDAEYLERVGAVSDKIINEIHRNRIHAHPATYTETDFAAADARTVEGRYALECFKAKVTELLAAGARGGQFAWYADDCLMHLPVAFLPAVGLQQAADAIVDALGGVPNGTGDTFVPVSGRGYKIERGPAKALHAGRIDPARVPEMILAAIARPGPWARGELLPTAQNVPASDAARLARLLDRDLFSKTVATATNGLQEVRSEGGIRGSF